MSLAGGPWWALIVFVIWGIGVLAHWLAVTGARSKCSGQLGEAQAQAAHGRGPLRRAHFSGGGTTFMTNEVGFSFAPKGPGTLLLSGGRLLR